ncbi:helix-turn-helix domain-containing protein [Candidatus Nucleicultrix amoebiphila]|jgi:transcriptional regulator with XRE-family HTH domain|uniref:helix-turn-helix domain-containing protein n=1 Tax=Candidatus Nucleicultrix amoebiphila TaxID=1509244 RepID=UPI000A26CB47|nr:helix-turn-helix transcriptional regulator [Candidatus Nucleicultrix amoebiphila]
MTATKMKPVPDLKSNIKISPRNPNYENDFDEEDIQNSNFGPNNLISFTPLSPNNKNKVALRKRKKSKHPLRDFRIRRGYTLEELAELTRLSPSYLSRLESGTRRLNADVLHRLALVLSCHPGDLLVHDSSSTRFLSQAAAGYGEQGAIAMLPQDLPLYDIHNEGQKHRIDFDAASEWLTRPSELLGVPGAFAFKVKDESLGQRYRKEDQVFIHPNKALSPGCSLLVITRTDQALVGQFIQWRSDSGNMADTLVVRLMEKIGNEFCTKDISISKSNIKATYRIIGLMEAA